MMFKFLLKAITYLLATLVLGSIIIYFLITKKGEYFLGDPNAYLIWKYQINEMSAPSPYKNIIIGDSRGNAAVDPSVLGNNWINLSLPGSDFFEGYITLKKFTTTNKNDTLIMVYGRVNIAGGAFPLSTRVIPMQLMSKNDITNLEQLENQFSILYRNEQNLNPNEKISTAKLKTSQWLRRLQFYRFPLSYSGTIIDGFSSYVHDNRETNIQIKLLKELTSYRGHLFFGTSDSSDAIQVSVKEKFVPGIINLIYLDSIMTLAKEKNICTYLFVPPINKSTYNEYLNSLSQKSFNYFLETLNKKYPALKIIEMPEYIANKYFGDELHVNAYGCSLLTNNVKRFISRQ